MPWSPIPGMKRTVLKLQADGFGASADLGTLRRELVRQTGSINAKTLNSYLKTMEDFKLIKAARNDNDGIIIGIFELNDESEWEL